MLSASLDFSSTSSPRILCIGAHCDDIEIGCSGTLIRLLDTNPDIRMTWVVLTGESDRQAEVKASAHALSVRNSNIDLTFHSFRDGYLPYLGEDVKKAFVELKSRIDPDLIFSHWEGDRHQDHRLVSEMTWSTFRGNLILEYEIPKYDGDLGTPNVFVPLPDNVVNRKVDNIVKHFSSQAAKPWFDGETFRAMHRLRGIESGADTRYAEGFYCRKLCLLK